MGEAQQQCNECFSLASLSGKDANEQKRYLGKSIPADHWKYTRSLQTPPNQKDFENKYFIMMEGFCIQLKKSYHDCNLFWLFLCGLLYIYILYAFISIQ